MNKRTNIDFSKHEITIIESDGVLIHKFKKPNTIINSLIFINACGVMTVTGDFGNWVFCREFHPTPNSKVDGSYWSEKLRISSVQKSASYDSDETRNRIYEFKQTFEESYGREMNDEEKDWVESLEKSADDKYEYIFTAYRETPRTIDTEAVPYGEKRHDWLNAVYDGFEALCEKLNNHVPVNEKMVQN